jgi:hypothetical protein
MISFTQPDENFATALIVQFDLSQEPLSYSFSIDTRPGSHPICI